jgi:hypothetical protein
MVRSKCPPKAHKEFTVRHKWSGRSPGEPPSAPRAAAHVRGAILGAILGAQKCPKSDQKGSRSHRKFGSGFRSVFGPHFGHICGQMLVQNGAPERIRGAGFKFGPLLKIYTKTNAKSTFFILVGRNIRQKTSPNHIARVPETNPAFSSVFGSILGPFWDHFRPLLASKTRSTSRSKTDSDLDCPKKLRQ